MIPSQPTKGSPCNGCGVCCIAEQCDISLELFGLTQTCPALEFEDSRFWCGLMRHPGNYDAIPECFESLRDLGVNVEEVAAGYYKAMFGQMGCDSEYEEKLNNET